MNILTSLGKTALHIGTTVVFAKASEIAGRLASYPFEQKGNSFYSPERGSLLDIFHWTIHAIRSNSPKMGARIFEMMRQEELYQNPSTSLVQKALLHKNSSITLALLSIIAFLGVCHEMYWVKRNISAAIRETDKEPKLDLCT